MTNEVSEILRPLLEDLCWVEYYGGNLIPCTYVTQGKDVIVPISCDVQDCHEYLFVPNFDKCSILFTQNNGVIRYDKVSKFHEIKGSLLLSGWVNSRKLGLNCNTNYAFELVDVLCGFKFDRLTITSVRELNKSRSYFEPFSFANDNKLFVHPFQYFTLEINYTLPSCKPEPIDCEFIECPIWK